MKIADITPADTTAIILAGGRGSRLGGLDKGLVTFEGRRLIEAVLERIRPHVGAVLISANRNLETYENYGIPVIPDDTPDFHGPLAGIAACLKQTQTRCIVTVPCDSPRLPRDLVSRLIHARNTHSAPLAVAHDGQRLQPLYLCFDPILRTSMEDYLQRGGRSVHGWISRQAHVVADFSDKAEGFLNINQPEDLETVASSADPPHISR